MYLYTMLYGYRLVNRLQLSLEKTRQVLYNFILQLAFASAKKRDRLGMIDRLLPPKSAAVGRSWSSLNLRYEWLDVAQGSSLPYGVLHG